MINKKIWGLLLFVFMVFIPLINAKAYVNTNLTKNGYSITTEQYQNLKELGFSKEEIDSMKKEELDYNKDIKAHLVGTDTKYNMIVYTYKLKGNASISSMSKISLSNIINDDYIDNNELQVLELVNEKSYDISEEEYNNLDSKAEYSINGEEIVETTGKKLVTTISYISSSKRYRLKNSLTWKNMPKNRYNDLYGILYEESNANTVVGSQHAYYNYTIYNGCTGKTSSYQKDYSNAKYWNTKSKSYYMSFKLQDDETVNYDWPIGDFFEEPECPCINPPAIHTLRIIRTNSVKSMSATMYYDIAKSTSTKIKMLTVAGEYQHAYKSIELSTSLNFGISKGSSSLSIAITPNYVDKYDGMKNTKVQLSGLNW